IRRNRLLVTGIISQVSTEIPLLTREDGYEAIANVDLMGEFMNADDDLQHAHFLRGVTSYPTLGDCVVLMGTSELRMIYHVEDSAAIDFGHLQQDAAVIARANINDLINKHFAILGSTGVGKSSGLAYLLRQILTVRPNLRIFLLDGHNEYGQCFDDRALVINPANLKLPFWLFTFEELLEVVFPGRPGNDEETEILAELIPLAKALYHQSREGPTARKHDKRAMDYTVDTPVPYR